MPVEIRTNYQSAKERLAPKKVEVERPGETFMIAKERLLPHLVAAESVGILILNVKQMGAWGLAFAPLYLMVHLGFKWLLRYTNHGNRFVAHSMNAAVLLMLVALSGTFFGQMAVEAVHSRKIEADVEYKEKRESWKAEQADYDKWLEKREQASLTREEQRTKTAEEQRRANEETTKNTRALLALARKTKQTVKLPPAQQVAEVAQGGDQTPAADRRPPAEPPSPGETAIQFYGRWLFILKLAQFGDLGILLLAVGVMLFGSTGVNEKSRQLLVSEEDRQLVPFVMTDPESLSNLPNWRPVAPLPCSLESAKNDDSQVNTPDQKSGEEIGDVTEDWGSPQLEGLPHLNEQAPPEAPPGEEEVEIEEVVTPDKSQETERGSQGEPIIESQGEKDGSPQSPPGALFEICGGAYRLKRKMKNGKPAGFDLRHGQGASHQTRDICYVGEAKGQQIIGSDLDTQQRLVEEILERKRGGLRQVLEMPTKTMRASG